MTAVDFSKFAAALVTPVEGRHPGVLESGAGPDSAMRTVYWIPAFAGMTEVDFSKFAAALVTPVEGRHPGVLESGAGPDSAMRTVYWIPAFAGMTEVDLAAGRWNERRQFHPLSCDAATALVTPVATGVQGYPLAESPAAPRFQASPADRCLTICNLESEWYWRRARILMCMADVAIKRLQ
jgi:hypothetical protein